MSEVPIRRLEKVNKSAAKVAGTFWPHIMCCDSGRDDDRHWINLTGAADTDSLFVSASLNTSLSTEAEQCRVMKRSCASNPSSNTHKLHLKKQRNYLLTSASTVCVNIHVGCGSSSDFPHKFKQKPHRQIESFLFVPARRPTK